MRRKMSRRIYRTPHGMVDGWLLVVHSTRDDGNRADLGFYYVGPDGAGIRWRSARARMIGRKIARTVGSEVGEYDSTRPEIGVPFEDQPEEVKNQRHAYHLYQCIEDARGSSPTIAVRAAEKFGPDWEDTGVDDWLEVRMVGEGRAERIAQQIEQ